MRGLGTVMEVETWMAAPDPPSKALETLQARLNVVARSGIREDGGWGDETQTAILRFQVANGFPQTGVPDAKTLFALKLTAPSIPVWLAQLRRAVTGDAQAKIDRAALLPATPADAVGELQRAVGAPASGVWGSSVRQFVAAAQKKAGLPDNGLPTRATLKAVFRTSSDEDVVKGQTAIIFAMPLNEAREVANFEASAQARQGGAAGGGLRWNLNLRPRGLTARGLTPQQQRQVREASGGGADVQPAAADAQPAAAGVSKGLLYGGLAAGAALIGLLIWRKRKT